jgi:hypothetical protein
VPSLRSLWDQIKIRILPAQLVVPLLAPVAKSDELPRKKKPDREHEAKDHLGGGLRLSQAALALKTTGIQRASKEGATVAKG